MNNVSVTSMLKEHCKPWSLDYQCFNCDRRTSNKKSICWWCKQLRNRKREGGQGRSSVTKSKEENIIKAVRLSVRLSSGYPYRFYPFWYISLNCGSGKNTISNKYGTVDVDGEPILFLREMETFDGRPYRAWFCDKEEDLVCTLARTIGVLGFRSDSNRCLRYFAGNNKFVMEKLLLDVDTRRSGPIQGAIVSDPNGPSGDHTPYLLLKKCKSKCPFLDLIMNINYGTLSRSNGVRKIPNFTGKWLFDPNRGVRGVMDYFGPSVNWLVSKPLRNGSAGANNFMVVIGRKSESDGVCRQEGFYPATSEQGIDWINETIYT